MWYPCGIKKENHFIHVFLKVGHAYVTVADETWVPNNFPFFLWRDSCEYAVTYTSRAELRARTHKHTHTQKHARVNYVTVYDVIQGESRAAGVKGSKGSALPRVVTAPERVRRNASEDRWRHSGKSIPGATCDVTCRMGVDWRQQWRKQLRDLP